MRTIKKFLLFFWKTFVFIFKFFVVIEAIVWKIIQLPFTIVKWLTTLILFVFNLSNYLPYLAYGGGILFFIYGIIESIMTGQNLMELFWQVMLVLIIFTFIMGIVSQVWEFIVMIISLPFLVLNIIFTFIDDIMEIVFWLLLGVFVKKENEKDFVEAKYKAKKNNLKNHVTSKLTLKSNNVLESTLSENSLLENPMLENQLLEDDYSNGLYIVDNSIDQNNEKQNVLLVKKRIHENIESNIQNVVDVENNILLTIELVPNSSWYQNLRSILTKKEWDIVRKDSYHRAKGKCVICQKEVTRLEAHETWEYDEENGIQKLVEVRALCRECHEVKHYGRTNLYGRGQEAEEHFCKVNHCSDEIFELVCDKAFADWSRRNKINWKLDISWLEENGFHFNKKCPKCNNELIIKKEKWNDSYSCEECEHKEKIICKDCGEVMRVMEGKYGLFLGCSGYPDCKNTKNI